MQVVETTGPEIPKLGLGTWQTTGDTCAEAVRAALEAGYRHVDTAQVYDNEAAVGRGLERASVDSDEVFVTTKVWRSNLRADDVHSSVRESVDRLGVDTIDLLLIHWPHPRVDVSETLTAMAELCDEGLVEHLGVSNFTRDQLAAARRQCPEPIVANQVLYHPYKDQSALREYCATEDVALVAYSPLARGDVLDDDVLAEIGERHGVTAAQVALRWLVQQEGVVAIPKSTSPAHIRQNHEVFDVSLSPTELERIDDLTGSLGVRLRNRLPSLVRRVPF